MERRLISIVIPAYNEESNVRRAYDAVRAVFDGPLSGYDFEIVFTDNHSTDSTFDRLRELAAEDERVRAVRFTRNFGFNKSLLTGYRLARGDAAIQLDCDLQDPPALFPEFVRKWENGHDVVVGIRRKRQESRLLQDFRKAFYRFLSRISEDNLVIDGGDFRLVDRSILDQLRHLHEASPYVRGLVSSIASAQTGIPYDREARLHDKSKFPLIPLLKLAIDGIVSHSTVPLRLASLAGFIIASLTALLSCAYFIGKVFFSHIQWPVGFTTQVLLILFGISLNAIFLGIIGEYISRIYQQIRERPLTVVEKSLNVARPVNLRALKRKGAAGS